MRIKLEHEEMNNEEQQIRINEVGNDDKWVLMSRTSKEYISSGDWENEEIRAAKNYLNQLD